MVRDVGQAEELAQDALVAALEQWPRDGLLRLVFTACHPVLAPEARVALTLRLLGGVLGPYALQAAIGRLPCPCAHRAGDRLDAHRGRLRSAVPARALARRGVEPRGRAVDGLRGARS